MSTITAPLSNTLIGSLMATEDPAQVKAAFEAQGGDPTALEVLTGHDDVARHFTSTSHLGPLGRLARRVSLAADDTAAHVIETVRIEVALGRAVVIVHGVGRAQVAEAACQLRGIGAHHLRYTGRWTSNEHGLIPRPDRPHAA